jgi:hypothetical protein
VTKRVGTIRRSRNARWLAIAALSLASGVRGQENPKPIWSVSLEPQGFKRESLFSTDWTILGGVAATSDAVGVAIGNHPRTGVKETWRTPWEVYVLFYDSKSGKFLSKRGPWTSHARFRIVSTAGGKFLLFLDTPTEVLLLSSSGEEFKRIKLAELGAHISFLVSPSGRTILLAASKTGEVRYQVLNAETLQAIMDWVEKQDRGPFVTSTSDESMIGRDYPNYEVREFRGEWKILPHPGSEKNFSPRDPFGPNAPSFLHGQTIIGRAYDSGNEFVVPVVQTDGTLVSQHIVRKLPDYNYFGGVAASQDGHYFGLSVTHVNQYSRSWADATDTSPLGAGYFFYVWQSDVVSPIARIRVGRHMREIGFFPPGIPKIAVVDNGTLKVVPLPTKPIKSEEPQL